MKHQVLARYPASPDVIMKMFSDRAFHTRKLDAMQAEYKVLAHSFDGQTFSIRVERKVPVQLPGMKKAAETSVINEEVWHLASRTGSVKVELAMPLDAKCVVTISADGEHSLITYDWDVKSKVPLVGGQIEKMAVADMDRRSADETRVAIDLIQHYR